MQSGLATAERSSLPTIAKPSWPDWSGETAVCIATGPSLTSDQVEAVRRANVRTIAINDAGHPSRTPSATWCDIWYAADQSFWLNYRPESNALKVCAESKCNRRGELFDIVDLFLDLDDAERARAYVPGYALHGGHGGYQCLQLAMSLGATRILLLGYDCQPRGDQTNYFGRKPAHLHKDSPYKAWVQCYDKLVLKEGVKVINCTPGSAIKAYSFADIRECL